MSLKVRKEAWEAEWEQRKSLQPKPNKKRSAFYMAQESAADNDNSTEDEGVENDRAETPAEKEEKRKRRFTGENKEKGKGAYFEYFEEVKSQRTNITANSWHAKAQPDPSDRIARAQEEIRRYNEIRRNMEVPIEIDLEEVWVVR